MINELKKIVPAILENEPLSKHTTFKIGGPAKFFCLISDENILIKILNFAKENRLNILIIGSGGNILVSDNGFDGLAIKLYFRQVEFNQEKVIVSADFPLTQLVALAVSRGLTGLEFFTGIPGTVGGAIVGNAGAYGGEMAQILEKIELLDNNLTKLTLANEKLNFSYRHSNLKGTNFIILKAYLSLKKDGQKLSLELMKKYALDRWQKHPHEPSAGSTFKNVTLTDEILLRLQNKGWQIPEKFLEYKKIPAAWLIEQLDLKGKKIGGALVSEKHANHLINIGNAKAGDVVQLISYVKQQVRDKLGIQLEEEISYVGF